jgi:PAS domain S-box-containing protein
MGSDRVDRGDQRAGNPSPGASALARISPEQLAEILDTAEDGIITVDTSQEIVFFNRGAARLFRYTAEEVVGQPLEVLLPGPFRATHLGQSAGIARARALVRLLGERREVCGQRKDGTEFPVEVSILQFGTDEETLFTAIFRDLMERKRAEEILRARTEELRVTTQQLWQAARLAGVGELAAGLAHELNNPLGTVSLRLEGVLARTPLGDPRRKALEVIEKEVARMAGLVANLLRFSRAGRDQVSAVDVCEEITNTIALVAHTLRKAQIRVEPDFVPGVPPIHADRQQLQQVFLHLFTNAADAMPRGGRLVPRVRTGGLPDSTPAVVIEVSDTGVGIPAALLPRVFDPFFTTKEEGKGTGLGLAICKRIIDQHRGTVAVESELGRGTTLRVTLPTGSVTSQQVSSPKSNAPL